MTTENNPPSEQGSGQRRRGDNAEVDPLLLELLVCPLTRAPLIYDRKAGELISAKAGLAYPVEAGIPVMLPGQARKLTEAEQTRLQKRASG